MTLLVGAATLLVVTAVHKPGKTRAAAFAIPTTASSEACKASNADVIDDFSAGSAVLGNDAVAILEDCLRPNPKEVALGLPVDSGMYAKTYVYGTCTPPADVTATGAGGGAPEGGCSPPAEVQVFDSCHRSPAMYARQNGSEGGPAHQEVTMRGVPAWVFDDGTRIELYTGRSTVVVWGQTPELAKATAGELRGTGTRASVTTGQDLPAPVQGAMEGMLKC